LTLKKEHEIAVIEMGANHIGEIAALCSIAEPTHGMITNIGKAHLEGFGGIEGVIRAKTEMYDWLKMSAGTIFVNASNNLLVQHTGSYSKVVCYGLTGTDSEIKGAAEKKGYYLAFRWKGNKGKDQWNYVNTKLTGDYNLENALSAICVGRYFDVGDDAINAAIESYAPSNQRSQVLRSGTNTIVLDAYNANPSSVAVALKIFR
jgi:UDP-N-acetylmuramoyl-tripeptide--D-alanyl-D-alanine ligase